MLTTPSQMTTLTEVLQRLKAKGHDNEFTMTDKGFTAGKNKYYNPEDLTIIKTYRFEGDSDPADSSILYLIQANDGLTGYSMDIYGAQTDQDVDYDEFVKKIKVDERDEQLIFEDAHN